MQHLTRILSSYITSLILMLGYACVLAIATFIEKQMGTMAAKTLVYYSPLFILWQFIMVVNFIAIVWKHRLWKRPKWGMMTIHAAFIVILAGAMCSHLFSIEGLLHLREGEQSNQIVVRTQEGTYFHILPFEVELIDFTLTRYPGSTSPSSFESEVQVHIDGKKQQALIFMNNVLDVKGYRFYQASYDTDECGTILSVNHDIIGRNITYSGYFLLLVGFIMSLFGKRSRFHALIAKLNKLHIADRSILCLVGLFLLSGMTQAEEQPKINLDQAIQQFSVKPEHAEAFGLLPMQSESGRMIPINTFSSEILRKLHKSEQFGKLNSDQFLLSLLALPDMWMRVPLIPVSNTEIISRYHLPDKSCSYLQVFDSHGAYKFQQQVEEAYNKQPNERTRFDKDLMKLDEQVNILHQLLNYRLLRIFPNEKDPNHKWYAPGDDLSSYSGKDSMFVSRIFIWYLGEVQTALKSQDWSKADEVLAMIGKYQQAKNKTLDTSPKKMQAEVKYNQMNIFGKCKVGYLIAGGLLLILSFIRMFRETKEKTGPSAHPFIHQLSNLSTYQFLLIAAVLVVFLFHTYGMGMRWYIGGYAPWSNSYETMVYVAWATVAAGGVLGRSRITLALAAIFGGIILFVSGLNWMDPQIGTLVPVLKSPWLMFHVAVIVAAYGFFGICCLLGITNMILMGFVNPRTKTLLQTRIKELTLINEMALLIGLAFMTIGTFLGAIWANESWGRYWGWDPKETWALITLVVYAIVEHLRLVRRWYNLWSFNFLTILAFGSVLMTFFGVNYFLSGMHSYGENEQVSNLFNYLFLAIIGILALALWAFRKHNLIDK